MLNHRVARTYAIPYVDRVSMPAHWADWLSKRADGNPRLGAEPAVGDLKTWDHERHGPAPWMQFFYDWRFGDLFNRGQLDLLLTCGAFRQAAYDAAGNPLWSYEDPEAGFMDIRLDSNFPVADIDGDGRTEAVVPRKIDGALHICILDAATGELRQSAPYPGLDARPPDLRGSITLARLGGPSAPLDIVVGWDYNALWVLDAQLATKWDRQVGAHPGRKHRAMGHTPLAYDFDGDGRDELWAGSTLLSADGEVLWVAPDLPAIVRDGHCDSPIAVDLHGDGQASLVVSTGAYCFDRPDPRDLSNWRLAWGLGEAVDHGQAARAARLLGDTPGQQVVIYDNINRAHPDKPDAVLALDADGRALWRREFFGPDMQEGGFGFWVGDWDGDGLDEVLVNDRHDVHVLRGSSGEEIGTLPGHLVFAYDLTGDSRIEAVVVDKLGPGQQLMILQNADPHPSAEATLERRAAGPALYNYTRY